MFLILAACTSYVPSPGAGDDDQGDASATDRPGELPVEAGVSTDAGADATPPRGDGAVPPTPQPPSADEQQMLDFINATRSGATDAVPPLNPVSWDAVPAEALRAWVGCTTAQPPVPGGTSTLYGTAGASTSVAQLMQHLADTRAYYTRSTNTCTPDPQGCQYYTDMVQRGVNRVACVWGPVCPGPPPGESGTETWRTWACQFAPLPDPLAQPY